MFSIEICIDVPDLARGITFYAEAFGFSEAARPYPGVAVLRAGEAMITLLEKREQTRATSSSSEVRRYARHWTPVHLDFHVENVRAARDRVIAAGATQEQFFDSAGHGPAAFCADPFGNGFCLLQRRAAAESPVAVG